MCVTHANALSVGCELKCILGLHYLAEDAAVEMLPTLAGRAAQREAGVAGSRGAPRSHAHLAHVQAVVVHSLCKHICISIQSGKHCND